MAAMEPLIIAGREAEMDMVPCFQRKILEITAAGIKKSKTIPRAVKESVPSAKVSQRINRLPPPMPKPVKNPSSVPMSKFMAIDTVYLPI